jgi:PAS domain-containing protein
MSMAYLLIPLVSPSAAPDPDPDLPEPLAAWVAVASASPDACLVLDHRGRVAGCSEQAAELLGEMRQRMRGRVLVGDVIEVVDFSAQAGPGDFYSMRIPPLMALASDMPARGLLRVRHGDGRRVTLDAVSAPLHGSGGHVAGSVSFLVAVTPG